MMIYAETNRLILRALRRDDLPRLTSILNDWEVVRWLLVVPYPYRIEHSEEFYAKMCTAYKAGTPEFFAIEPQSGGGMIGGVGLHPSREAEAASDELVIGYWLGRDYWGKGTMTEAVRAVIDLAFARKGINHVSATTDPDNDSSQKVLRKAGLHYVETSPRRDTDAMVGVPLRGSKLSTRWLLTRADYEKEKA